MKRDKNKKVKRKKYISPVLERYKVSDLSKGWDLESIGLVTSCPEFCTIIP